jgi:CPA1 family monovalent cation:H+ antiporter
MEVTVVVIGIIFAIVFSNVLASIYPRLSLPLVQIAFGTLLGLTVLGDELTLDPEVFLVLVVAPLLFHEADEANVLSLWRVRRPIVFMAFLLVFATVLTVGYSVHALLPAAPLAACLALGAVLGPTDAAAVSSLSAQGNVGEKLLSILKGEGLINDASGLIAFNLAVTALVTGRFSLERGILQFFALVLGGAAVGFVLSSVEQSAIKLLRRRAAVSSIATFLLIELMMPFLNYMVAEAIGVSGIIAAVIAGSRQSSAFDVGALFDAQVRGAKRSLWELLSFSLNSLVFLLLGLQIPKILDSVWNQSEHSRLFLVVVIVAVTAIIALVRWISVFVVARSALGDGLRQHLLNSLLLTLSGVKGTVSLSMAFALPTVIVGGQSFEERNLLLFIATGVIILSLVLALVLIPVMSREVRPDPRGAEARRAVLASTMAALAKEPASAARQAVLRDYAERLADVENQEYSGSECRALQRVRRAAYRADRRTLRAALRARRISRWTYRTALELVYFFYRRTLPAVGQRAAWLGVLLYLTRDQAKASRSDALVELTGPQADAVAAALEGLRGREPDAIIDRVRRERLSVASRDDISALGSSYYARLGPDYAALVLDGYRVEREAIARLSEQARITPAEAAAARIIVDQLELNALEGNREDLMAKVNSIVEARRSRRK